MQILVNGDNQISVDARLTEFVQDEVGRALGRFGGRLTRVEVHLSDHNGPKSGASPDKRCLIEARPSGWQPVSASDDANSVAEAVSNAANKMKCQLESAFGRAADKR
ncbi:HPF/RaiA family ribosome-associated protein [Edaphobacter albus]|uniref:HPF/RaiA family ribosome-associated protein n=1 Tax=Edaphobacter sp. 4G125 TaxID=2763071 RepID=UPI00164415E0|nr:HPF/RaiA family ribosome-associated protein [Edaphobacter sp. 4G125]QNI38292.1 HPF/RaiA family ribosome-associated protein [Edaphobacter sp. 4G125]